MTSHESEDDSAVSGRGWAYAGMLVGAMVSTAANLAHSYIPPMIAPAWWPTGKAWDRTQWHPQLGAVIGAVFWPIGLFLASELLVRITWPDGRRWVVLRFGGLLPVAAVAAIVSYKHLSALIGYYGEDYLTAHIGPLAVDGLMVMATGALVATSGHRQPPAADMPTDTELDSTADSVSDAADTSPDNKADIGLGHPDTRPDTALDTPPDTAARVRPTQPDTNAAILPDMPVAACPTEADIATDTVSVAAPDITQGSADSVAARTPGPPYNDAPDEASETAHGRRASAEEATSATRPTGEPPKRIPAPRASSPAGTAAKVESVLQKHPDLSTVAIAKRIGVSDRTVRRHLADRRQTAELTAGTPGNRSPDGDGGLNGHGLDPGRSS